MLRILLLSMLGLGTIHLAADEPVEELPVALSLVPEMQIFAELDWDSESLDPPADLKHATEEILKLKPFLMKQVTPARVRAMSKWAQKQMAEFKQPPRLDDVKLVAAAKNHKRKEWLLEATLQTLPSHSPLVDRWLKLYVVYDQDDRRISRVIVTIRGQALE